MPTVRAIASGSSRWLAVWLRMAATVVMVTVPGRAAGAQRLDDAIVAMRGSAPSASAAGPEAVPGPASVALVVPEARAEDGSFRRSALPPLASALLPGSGQALLRQDRFVAYLAVEGYAWLRYATDVAEAKRQRRVYRTLARRVARAGFGGTAPVGDFEYYEHMKYWAESGAFDRLPGGGVDPETDATTFNGATWLLARRTYWPDPESPPAPDDPAFAEALAFYVERAITPQFQWSWRGAELEQDLFGRTIDRSNEAYRRAFEDLGLVIANHVLSTIDAYVTVRLRARREPGGSLRVGATVPWSPADW